MDFTWGAGGSTSATTLQLAIESQKKLGLEVNMHLTCTNMDPEKVKRALQASKVAGIRNIVALRGDPPNMTGEVVRIWLYKLVFVYDVYFGTLTQPHVHGSGHRVRMGIQMLFLS